MKYVLAIDSFKGCMSSVEVEETVGDTLKKQGSEVVAFPMSDAGIGMLEALTDAFGKGGTIDDALAGVLKDCKFTLASDVRNPLYGENGAARVYGRQKGATDEMIDTLDAKARYKQKRIRSRPIEHVYSWYTLPANYPHQGAKEGTFLQTIQSYCLYENRSKLERI